MRYLKTALLMISALDYTTTVVAKDGGGGVLPTKTTAEVSKSLVRIKRNDSGCIELVLLCRLLYYYQLYLTHYDDFSLSSLPSFVSII